MESGGRKRVLGRPHRCGCEFGRGRGGYVDCVARFLSITLVPVCAKFHEIFGNFIGARKGQLYWAPGYDFQFGEAESFFGAFLCLVGPIGF